MYKIKYCVTTIKEEVRYYTTSFIICFIDIIYKFIFNIVENVKFKKGNKISENTLFILLLILIKLHGTQLNIIHSYLDRRDK